MTTRVRRSPTDRNAVGDDKITDRYERVAVV